MTGATDSEWLTVVAARNLKDRGVVFAGHGLPTLAVALAQRTVAPTMTLVYESGVIGAHPTSLPRSITDPVLVAGAECVLSTPQLFNLMLQGGRVDVGFLGAAQIDRDGSLNSSVLGDWHRPDVRLPGSGGAIEVMANAAEVFVVMRRHDPRAFVEKLDFCTSPSPRRAADAQGLPPRGKGVTRVVTELGLLGREATEELRLVGVREGVSVAQVRDATGWDLVVSPDLKVIPEPSSHELDILRKSLDPNRIYLR